MDFKTKWAIQQAHKTLLEFGHLLDERAPSSENDARLHFKIPTLSADAMRAARGLETALQVIEAEDTAKCTDRPSAFTVESVAVDRTTELKNHVSTEFDGLREWLHSRDLRSIAVAPEPAQKGPRHWLIILTISLTLAAAMTIGFESFLRNQNDTAASISHGEPRALERIPETDSMLRPSEALQPLRTK